jgi:hypothetical protein
MSYPLGGQDVDAALHEAPHADGLELAFTSGTTAKRSNGRLQPYLLLSAEYHNRPPTLSSPNDRTFLEGEHWMLWVHPVPRECRARVRALLLEHALPRIREWLSCERPPIWYSGSKRLEFRYDEQQSALQVIEHAHL